MKIEVFARTEQGCVRERNEDSFAVVHLESPTKMLDLNGRAMDAGQAGTLAVVCDGMGGAGNGDQASRIACSQFITRVKQDTPRLVAGRIRRDEVLRQALEEADRAISNAVERDRSLNGMGTTLTAALFGVEGVDLIHVGDSRAYRFNDGALEQVTEDHSVTGQMVAAGRMSEEEARVYPHRDQLLQALGRGVKLAPQVTRLQLERGESLLLCSDGLPRMLSTDEVSEVLVAQGSCVRACRSLTEMACARGARDNVTVCIVRRVS